MYLQLQFLRAMTHAVILTSQNRGKVPLESSDTAWTQRVSCYMNGGQLDGATLEVKPFNLLIRPQCVFVHLFTVLIMDVAAVGEEEEAQAPIRVRSLVSVICVLLVSVSITIPARSPRYDRRHDAHGPPRQV